MGHRGSGGSYEVDEMGGSCFSLGGRVLRALWGGGRKSSRWGRWSYGVGGPYGVSGGCSDTHRAERVATPLNFGAGTAEGRGLN